MRFLERRKVKIKDLKRPPWYQESEYDEETLAYLRSSFEKVPYFDPITVRKMPNGELWLADGWHRCKVLEEKGIEEIDAEIYEMTDDEYLNVHTASQIARGKTNPLQVAKLVHEHLKRGKSEEEVAELFGKNVRWVKLYKSISEMPPKYQEALARGQLSIGVIDAALALEDDNEINLALDYAILYKYTIQEMRNYVKKRKEDLRAYQEKLAKEEMVEKMAPKADPEIAYMGKCGLCGQEVHSMYLRGAAICPDCLTIIKMVLKIWENTRDALPELQKILTEYQERKLYERLKAKFEKKPPEEKPLGEMKIIPPPSENI